MRLFLKSGDTKQLLTMQLSNEKGKVNLTGCTVKIIITNYQQDITVVDDIATISDVADGVVEYAVGASIITPATYYGEFEVVYPNGKVELFPKREKIIIGIIASLRDKAANSFLTDGGNFTDASPTNIMDGGSF